MPTKLTPEEEALVDAWYLMLDLLPSQFKSSLAEVAGSADLASRRSAESKLIHEVLAEVQEQNAARWKTMWEPYARCPLCKGSSGASGADGFKVPAGLEKHLRGSGNANKCPAIQLARDAGRATSLRQD